MASLSEFLSAVQVFNKSMNNVATRQAMSDAQEERESIKNSLTDQAEQRMELKDLANKTAGTLIGLGRDPTHIAQAMEVLGPENFANAGEAIMEGILADRPDLVEQGMTAQSMIGKPERQLKRDLQRNQFEQEKLLAMFEQQAKREASQLALRKEEAKLFVPGFGIARSEKDATELKNFAVQVGSAMDDVKKLIRINNELTAEVDPRRRAQAAALRSGLLGKLRETIAGPGPMSEADRELIEGVIPNPTDILEPFAEVKLNTLLETINNVKNRQAETRVLRKLDRTEVRRQLSNLSPKQQSLLSYTDEQLRQLPPRRQAIAKWARNRWGVK